MFKKYKRLKYLKVQLKIEKEDHDDLFIETYLASSVNEEKKYNLLYNKYTRKIHSTQKAINKIKKL